jgi:cell division septation protein DedD
LERTTRRRAGLLVVLRKVKVPIEKPVRKMGSRKSASASLTGNWLDVDSPASLEKSLSFPYSLYLGSFRDRQRVDKAVSIYRKRGLSPYWVEMDFKEKGTWFRVYAGHFSDRGEAESLIKRLELREATVKNTRYVNLLGVYPQNGARLKSQARSLESLGYSPYAIKDDDGKYRLYVGGFLRKARAEEQQRDLQSKGIQCHVVLK